jgi:hypothetical protein
MIGEIGGSVEGRGLLIGLRRTTSIINPLLASLRVFRLHLAGRMGHAGAIMQSIVLCD